jgi:hypothetical protein
MLLQSSSPKQPHIAPQQEYAASTDTPIALARRRLLARPYVLLVRCKDPSVEEPGTLIATTPFAIGLIRGAAS